MEVPETVMASSRRGKESFCPAGPPALAAAGTAAARGGFGRAAAGFGAAAAASFAAISSFCSRCCVALVDATKLATSFRACKQVPNNYQTNGVLS